MTAGIKINTLKDVAAIDEMIRRTREALVAEYRAVVWEIFCRILEQTPQFTGRAVAHWDIQVDGDTNYFDDPGIGDEVDMVDPDRNSVGMFKRYEVAKTKGATEHIEIAKARNRPKLDRIRRGSVVRFTNNVRGDDDEYYGTRLGRQSEFYMQALQEPTYWKAKLRAVNQPYETAQESIALVQWFYSTSGNGGNGVVTFRHTRYGIGKIWK